MAKESNKTDSVAHTEERHARLKEESARLAKEETRQEADRQEKQAIHDMKAEDAEIATLERHAVAADPETRDQLLERIRQLRDDAIPKSPPPPLGMSEFQKQQLEIEQNAGRERVRKTEEEMARNRESNQKAEVERAAREGTMETVHQPNPGQDEQFPAQKATLGKTK